MEVPPITAVSEVVKPLTVRSSPTVISSDECMCSTLTLPNEPVEIDEPLTFPLAVTCSTFFIELLSKFISCVAVWFPKLSPPATAAANEADTSDILGNENLPPIVAASDISNLPNEPVEVDEPLIRFEPPP